MHTVRIIHEYLQEHERLNLEVGTQIAKALRLDIIKPSLYHNLRLLAYSGLFDSDLDISPYSKLMQVLKLSRQDAESVICIHWFFTRRLNALAAKAIFSRHPDKEFWDAEVDKFKDPQMTSNATATEEISIIRYDDERHVFVAHSLAGKQILVSTTVKFVNGPYREGYRVEYADLDAGVLFGWFKYE